MVRADTHLAGKSGPIGTKYVKIGDFINTPNGFKAVIARHESHYDGTIHEIRTKSRRIFCTIEQEICLSSVTKEARFARFRRFFSSEECNWLLAGFIQKNDWVQTVLGPEKITHTSSRPCSDGTIVYSFATRSMDGYYINGIQVR